MADYTQFNLRGDTKSNWLNANPVLSDREIALETDTQRFKIGNGTSYYNQLPYGRNTGEYLNFYNVTALAPLTVGNYYTHETAILAVPSSERTKGTIVSYETASGVWYTERFIGSNVANWSVLANWEKVPDAGDIAQLRSDLNEIEQEQIQGGVYDVSYHNDGAVFESLSTLLGSANLSTLIPISVRRGGMSIRFVQSYDNKYVQYRLTVDEWSVDIEDWTIADEGVYVDSPEFIYVKTDNDGKILYGVNTDGRFYFGAGCPPQVVEYITSVLNDKLDSQGLDSDALGTVKTVENPEYIQVTTDGEGKILEGITLEGVKQINLPINTPSARMESVENPEWLSAITDSEGKVLGGRKQDGTVVENVGIEVKKATIEEANISALNLSAEGIENLKVELNISFDIPEAYLVKDMPKHVITVDCTGKGDYSSIKEAINSIEDSSYNNQYEILVLPGVYHEGNIDIPDYIHLHGIFADRTIISDEGLGKIEEMIDIHGYCKISNITIHKTQQITNSCLHYDYQYLVGKSFICENVIFINSSGQGIIAAGSAFAKGTKYIFNDCIFEGNGFLSFHSQPNGNFDNTIIELNRCQFKNGAWLQLGSVGGFGTNICSINNCSFDKSTLSLITWFSSLRNKENPATYLSNYLEWSIVGRNNDNLNVYMFMADNNCPKTLRVVSNEAVVGQEISADGSAVDVLFGNPIIKKGGVTIPAHIISQYRIEDSQAGASPYTEQKDVFQMWKRLGDCSTNPLTLNVYIGSTLAGSFTFNKNYLESKDSQSSILSEVNNSLNGCNVEEYTNKEWMGNVNMPDNIIKIKNTNAGDIDVLHCIKKDGTVADNTTLPSDFLGTAMNQAAPNDYFYVSVGDAIYAPLTDGVASIGNDGKLVTNVTNPEHVLGNVKNYTLYINK